MPVNTSPLASMMLTDNYIYISHLEGEPIPAGYKEVMIGEDPVKQDLPGGATANISPVFWVIPTYPNAISDSMQSNFQPTNALGRSAPVYTYQNSGPRTVQIDISLHRDIMDQANIGISNVPLLQNSQGILEDYTDSLIRALQSIALPKYNLTNKLIEPPLVAVRLSNEIFIKGVVTSAIGTTYQMPILSNNRYACVKIGFQVSEVDPYDSTTVFKNGTFRGMVNTFRRTESNGVIEQRMGTW